MSAERLKISQHTLSMETHMPTGNRTTSQKSLAKAIRSSFAFLVAIIVMSILAESCGKTTETKFDRGNLAGEQAKRSVTSEDVNSRTGVDQQTELNVLNGSKKKRKVVRKKLVRKPRAATVKAQKRATHLVEYGYRAFLGRTADAAGRKFWTAKVASGQLSRGALFKALRKSPEAIAFRKAGGPAPGPVVAAVVRWYGLIGVATPPVQLVAGWTNLLRVKQTPPRAARKVFFDIYRQNRLLAGAAPTQIDGYIAGMESEAGSVDTAEIGDTQVFGDTEILTQYEVIDTENEAAPADVSETNDEGQLPPAEEVASIISDYSTEGGAGFLYNEGASCDAGAPYNQ